MRCEDDVSGQLVAAIKSPFESAVVERWQQETTQDSAASFSFAFRSWLYLLGGNEKGHIRLIGMKALILHCGLYVNYMFALPSAHVRKREAVG